MGLNLKSFSDLRKFGTKAVGTIQKLGNKYGTAANIGKAADFITKKALPSVEKIAGAVAMGAKYAAPIVATVLPQASGLVGLVGKGASLAQRAAQQGQSRGGDIKKALTVASQANQLSQSPMVTGLLKR
jgi:hypothetical protein